jgi:hypothetical protein
MAWWWGAVRQMRRWLPLRDEDGQGLVEFAFVLFPLLAILLGIVEFGLVWNRQNDAVHLANEAARLVAVNNVTCAALKGEANTNGVNAGTITLPANPSAVGTTGTVSVSGIPIADFISGLIPGGWLPKTVSGSASMRIEVTYTGPATCSLS